MADFKPTHYVVYREKGKPDEIVAAFTLVDDAEMFCRQILAVDGDGDNYFMTNADGLRQCDGGCGEWLDIFEDATCLPCQSEAAYGAEMDRRIDIARGK